MRFVGARLMPTGFRRVDLTFATRGRPCGIYLPLAEGRLPSNLVCASGQGTVPAPSYAQKAPFGVGV